VKSVYLVHSGVVSLERVLPNGDTLTLNRVRSGALLAEASLFANNYHCDAIVREPAELLALKKTTLINRLEDAPQTLFTLTGDTAREVQRLRSQLEILRIKRVAERLDAWLALNAPPTKGGWIDVAHTIGVSPPALYRELARRRAIKTEQESRP
jgi:CRP-like cAMP-binding protein